MIIDARISRAFEAATVPLERAADRAGLDGFAQPGPYLPPDEPEGVDDIDLMGFVVPPIQYHIGLPRWEHWTFQARDSTSFSTAWTRRWAIAQEQSQLVACCGPRRITFIAIPRSLAFEQTSHLLVAGGG